VWGGELQGIYAATADGLFSTTFTDAGPALWVPLTGASVPNAQCGPAWTDAGTTYAPRRIDAQTTYTSNTIAITATSTSSDQVFFEGQQYDQGDDRFFACAATPEVQTDWPCPVCLPGELADFVVDGFLLRARCQGATGLSHLQSFGLMKDTTRPLTCPDPTFYTGAIDRSRAFSTQQGTMVLATVHGTVRQLPEGYADESMLLDLAAPIVRSDAGLYAGAYPYVEGIGFAESQPFLDPTAPVEQDPGELSAQVATSDGGAWVVAAAPYPQDSSILLGGADGGPLTFRISPRPFSSIISVAALPPFARPDGGVPFAAGYVLTVDALFYFEAATPLDWRAQEIDTPPGRYVSVWTDGHAGRVAADDGTIRSLPSLLELSDPFPDGGTASEYRRVCNQPYALTPAGVFRLQRGTSGGTASWSAVDLSIIPGFDVDTGLGPPAPELDYRPYARLDLLGQELFVTNTFGAVVRLTPPVSCP
jgi:hypothetical protein